MAPRVPAEGRAHTKSFPARGVQFAIVNGDPKSIAEVGGETDAQLMHFSRGQRDLDLLRQFDIVNRTDGHRSGLVGELDFDHQQLQIIRWARGRPQ